MAEEYTPPRSPLDGKPYYCALCGDQFPCDDGECVLETEKNAAERSRRRRNLTSDLALHPQSED